MQPCRHLDYEAGKFGPDIELIELKHFSVPVKFWQRGPTWTDNGPDSAPNPARVQFCKLRGRINGVFQCYNPGEMSCYEP